MQRTRLSKSQSKSFVRTRRDRRVWAVGIALVALLAWVFVLSRVSWLGIFSIDTVQVYGADPDISLSLRDAAFKQLEGAYLGLFSRADFMMYPKQDMAAAVLNASPRVQTVDIHHTGSHGLSVTVTERTPVATVCAELPDFTGDPADDPTCYFADADGLIFEQIPTSTPQIYKRYFEPDLATPVGAYATSTEKFNELQAFFGKVHDAGIVPLGILLKDAGEYELYIANPSSAGQAASTSTDANPDIAVVYFNDSSSFDNQLADLVLFWKKEMTEGHVSGALPRFESIDLRYGSNVFFRLEK